MTRRPITQMLSEQEEKLKLLEAEHKKMKAANTAYRETLSGKKSEIPYIPGVPYWRFQLSAKPYSTGELQTNRRIIQRTKERIAFLRERLAQAKGAFVEAPVEETNSIHNRSPDEQDPQETIKDPPSVRNKLQEIEAAKQNADSDSIGKNRNDRQEKTDIREPLSQGHQEKQAPVILSVTGRNSGEVPSQDRERNSIRDYLIRKLTEKLETIQAAEDPISCSAQKKRALER